MMRVALVNDLPMALEGLRRVITSMPDAEIAWTALDGREAVERCRADTPDVILMDMIMPEMDGVEATRRIMQECPCPIVVVTATVEGNASSVYEALGHGALDAVNTPVLGTSGHVKGAEALIRKIRVVDRVRHPKASAEAAETPAPAATMPRPAPAVGAGVGASSIVAIGASTGGPQALVAVLRALPRPLPCAVVIVQHVDVHFADGLARWLGNETGHVVRTAADGQPLDPVVWVAATEDHLVVRRHGTLRYVREPAEAAFRPSVDVFFDSLVAAEHPAGTAALLTGMGRDGAQGLLALKNAGWHTIAQDEATSVVWGMPAAAVKLRAAIEVLPIERVGPAIAIRCAATAQKGRS
jgi:two-component system response regulator WspF